MRQDTTPRSNAQKPSGAFLQNGMPAGVCGALLTLMLRDVLKLAESVSNIPTLTNKAQLK
jgi:hypothetical protein